MSLFDAIRAPHVRLQRLRQSAVIKVNCRDIQPRMVQSPVERLKKSRLVPWSRLNGNELLDLCELVDRIV